MASKSGKGYTAHDIARLIERARVLCFSDDFPSTASANWLLEGELGAPCWWTANSGKEHFEDKWHGALVLYFNVPLPDLSNLADSKNRACFDTVQKWSFAFRSGWLGPDPSPRYWLSNTQWVLSLVSWLYLRRGEFFPEEHGFGLLKNEDFQLLFAELSVDGWASALKLIERSFVALYELAYGEPPRRCLLDQLPFVSDAIVHDIVFALESKQLYVKNTQRDQRVICRKFLASRLGCLHARFNSTSVRKFLRGFEFEEGDEGVKILVPGHSMSKYPHSAAKNKLDGIEVEPPTLHAMRIHATYCVSFARGDQMPSIGIPVTEFSHDSIKELKGQWSVGEHRALIPLNEAFSVLNEAACWITQYGDDLLSFYDEYLSSRVAINVAAEGRSKEYSQVRHARVYDQLRDKAIYCEEESGKEFGVFSKLSLSVALSGSERLLKSGDLTLGQALFALIGACSYAIGMMKPLRQDELANIPFGCILRHNKTNGCFAEFPAEKSEKQGLKRSITRPIPYFTYLAIRLMQRLALISAKVFDEGRTPPRLFYFPSGLGFDSPPLTHHVSNSVNRCMDIFCDYVDLPLDSDGARRYFRVHELRKFFLLMLSWDDPEHGFEAGAWMAGHRNPAYIQAYTDSNATGVEISAWAAEQVEIKLLQIEGATGSRDSGDDLSGLYADLKRDLCVSNISGLPKAKFDSYVKNALDTGRYTVRLFSFKTPNGAFQIDFGVFMREARRGEK